MCVLPNVLRALARFLVTVHHQPCTDVVDDGGVASANTKTFHPPNTDTVSVSTEKRCSPPVSSPASLTCVMFATPDPPPPHEGFAGTSALAVIVGGVRQDDGGLGPAIRFPYYQVTTLIYGASF